MSNDSKVRAARGKPELAHLPLRLYIGVNRVMTAGAVKHGRGNWATVDIDDNDAGTRYLSALLRHVGELQTQDGRVTAESLGKVDDDSGLPAIDHAIANLLILRNIGVRAGVLKDDPGPGIPGTSATRDAVNTFAKNLTPEEVADTVAVVDEVFEEIDADYWPLIDVSAGTLQRSWSRGPYPETTAPHPAPEFWDQVVPGRRYFFDAGAVGGKSVLLAVHGPLPSNEGGGYEGLGGWSDGLAPNGKRDRIINNWRTWSGYSEALMYLIKED